MSKYPVIEVGDPWTADLANSMIPDFTYKQTATTRASTTTLADDPDLITPTLAANGIYLVEFNIRYAAIAAAALKTAWNVPAGVLSTNKEVLGMATANTDSNAEGSMKTGVHAYLSTVITYGNRSSAVNQARAYESSTVIMGATAGVVALQWAQGTSNATGSVVSAGSWVRTTRVG